jgi:hypothetical protein
MAFRDQEIESATYIRSYSSQVRRTSFQCFCKLIVVFFLATFYRIPSGVQLLLATIATLPVLTCWADSLGGVPCEVEEVLGTTVATNEPHLDGSGDVLLRMICVRMRSVD